jgi:hypothetical protein
MTRTANNFNSKRCAVIGMVSFKILLRTTQFANTFNRNVISSFLFHVNLFFVSRSIHFTSLVYTILMRKIITVFIFFELFRVHHSISFMPFQNGFTMKFIAPSRTNLHSLLSLRGHLPMFSFPFPLIKSLFFSSRHNIQLNINSYKLYGCDLEA